MSGMEEKLGYLTRAIEDNTKASADLRKFVESHMEKEEGTIYRIHKWLALLTVIIAVTHGTEVDWMKLFGMVV